MDKVKSIEDLPDELLQEIFSYLTFEDLVYSVQDVCIHWKDVSQNRQLWNDHVYRPDREVTDKEILQVLSRTPKLQTLLLTQKGVTSRVLSAVTKGCPYLKKLSFNSAQKLSTTFLRKLLHNCPDIESLHLPGEMFVDAEQINVVSQFTKLKELNISTFSSIRLELMVDGFPALEILDVRRGVFTAMDVSHFLQTKGPQLCTLGIPWYNLNGSCNLPLLSSCPNLNFLHLNRFFDFREDLGLLTLRSMKNLTHLSLYNLNYANVNNVIGLFEQRGMDQLKEFIITNFVNYGDRLAQMIIRNCPKLRVLRLANCSNLTDESLKELHELQDLEDIDFSYSRISDLGVKYITKCKSVRVLRINSCTRITKEGSRLLMQMSELKTLKCLYINGLPLNLVSTYLKKLRVLNINVLSKVDQDAVSKLRLEMPLLEIQGCAEEEDFLFHNL